MAMIKCKECGHDVSDKASVCPNCGCPIEKGTNHVSNKPVKNSKTKSWFLLALLFIMTYNGFTLRIGATNYYDVRVNLGIAGR